MATSSQLEREFADYQKTLPKMSDVRRREEGAAGLPGHRLNLQTISKNILDTGRLLKNVEGDVTSRAARLSGPVTEGQRRRLTSATQAPIQQMLGELSEAQTRQQVGLSDIETQVGQKLKDILSERFSKQDLFTQRIQRQMQREAMEQAARDAAAARASQQNISAEHLRLLMEWIENQKKEEAPKPPEGKIEGMAGLPTGSVTLSSQTPWDVFNRTDFQGKKTFGSPVIFSHLGYGDK